MNKLIVAQIIRQNIIAIGRIRKNEVHISPRSRIIEDLGLQVSDIGKILMTSFPIADLVPSKKISHILLHQKQLTITQFCRLLTENLISETDRPVRKLHPAAAGTRSSHRTPSLKKKHK